MYVLYTYLYVYIYIYIYIHTYRRLGRVLGAVRERAAQGQGAPLGVVGARVLAKNISNTTIGLFCLNKKQ